MRKVVVLILVISIFSTVGVMADSKAIFSDVPADHWAYNEIQFFYDAVVVDGVGNGRFAPDDNVTREQFAKLIAKIYEKDDLNYVDGVQTFYDVTPDRWSYEYIESVKEYLTGYYPEGGKPFFNPEADATREDVAYALVKIGGLDKQYTGSEDALNAYKDSDKISPHLRKYISVAIQAGLLQGYEEHTLRPDAGITRAETVTLLFRAIKKPVFEDETEVVPEEQEKTEDDKKEEPKEDVEEIKEDDVTKIINIERISGYTNVKGTIKVSTENGFFEANMKCYEGLGNVVACKIDTVDVKKCTNTTIEGTFKIMYDDVVKHSEIDGVVTFANGKLTFDATGANYGLVAYSDNYVNKEVVKEEEKPSEELKDKYIYYEVKEFEGEKADGTLMLHYHENGEFAEVSDFTVIVGESVYKYDIIEVSKNLSGSIYVKYTLECDNNVVDEKKLCKFDDYSKKLGEYVTFEKIKMQIVEIEG